MDVIEDAPHLGPRLIGDHPRAAGVVAVFGGVGDGIAHVRHAALVDQIDDQLDLVKALEIGHLRRVAGLGQGLISCLNERHHSAAEHHLLTEEIGLALFLERGLDHPSAPAANGRCIGQPDLLSVARGILVHRQQAWHAAAAQVFRAHRVARPLGRHHEDIEIGARLDQVEMDVEAMGKRQGRTFLHIIKEAFAIDIGLQLVRGQHHHHICPSRGFADRLHGQTGRLGLLCAGGAFPQRDPHVSQAAVF